MPLEVRVGALFSLSAICRLECVPWFLDAASDSDEQFANLALAALQGSGPGVVPPALARLSELPSGQGLRIALAAAHHGATDQRTTEELLAGLDRYVELDELRSELLIKLDKIGPVAHAATPQLSKLLFTIPETMDRFEGANVTSALYSVGRNDPEVAMLLRSVVLDRDAPSPRRAAAAWGLHDASEVPFWIHVLGDGDDGAARFALEALGEIGPAASSAIPALHAYRARRNDDARD